MKEQVWKRIDELEPQLWDLALRIHDHPELGFEEHQAAAWLAEALEGGGFRVERGAGGIPTAFRAVHPAAKQKDCYLKSKSKTWRKCSSALNIYFR